MKKRKQIKALVKFYAGLIKAQPKRIAVVLFKMAENVYDDLIVGDMTTKRFAKLCAWYHHKSLYSGVYPLGYKPTIRMLTAKQYKRPCNANVPLTKEDPSYWQLAENGQDYEMKPEVLERYRKSVTRQLDSWLLGQPVHNTEFDECCPDFSCCQPSLMWPEEERKAFAQASDEQRMKMLVHGLSSTISSAFSDKLVYVSGNSILN